MSMIRKALYSSGPRLSLSTIGQATLDQSIEPQCEVESSILMSDRDKCGTRSDFGHLVIKAFFFAASSACEVNSEKAPQELSGGGSPPGEVAAADRDGSRNGGALEKAQSPTPLSVRTRLNRLRRARPTCQLFAGIVPFRDDALPPRVSALAVGDGWGCAKLQDDAFYCWEAPGSGEGATRPVRAHYVSAFGSLFVAAGPDRACVAAHEERAVRCWRAPAFTKQLGSYPPSRDFVDASSWRLSLSDNGIFDRTPVLHGAVCGGRGGLFWGDTVAVGASNAAAGICRVGPIAVPCAIADQRVLSSFLPQDIYPGDDTGDVIIGDLFACKADRENGIWCVGASRDGFFGTREECPSDLLEAWPTSKGPVFAPNGKCARNAVKIGMGKYHGVLGTAGPRGLCLSRVVDDSHDALVCFGAVGLPQAEMNRLVVGLGDEPSACGVSESGDLLCWGEGFTATPNDDPVPIHFALPREGVGIDQPGQFHSSCGIQRNCSREARPLRNCSSAQPSLSVAEVVGLAEGFQDLRVTVRGALVLSPVMWSGLASIACGPFSPGKSGTPEPNLGKGGGYDTFCCPSHGDAPISVTNGADNLYIDGSFCSGDPSRSCCNIPVFGQQVQVTGILHYRESAVGVPEGLSLAEADICQARSSELP